MVVNDLGGASEGSGSSTQPADEVVEGIRQAGGTAVANYDTVATMSGAQNIIKAAIDNFGCIDILVNNAGIMRDRMFIDMTEDDWDLVLAVNLKGHFCCAKAARPYMIARRYGRIINMTSGAALGMRKGYVNYASSKAGVLGFTRSLAREVAEYGITVNAVMPAARTRLVDASAKGPGGLTSGLPTLTKTPESNAPLIVYLATDGANNINGCTFAFRFEGTIQLMSDPTVTKSIYKEGTWTIEQLSKIIPDVLMK